MSTKASTSRPSASRRRRWWQAAAEKRQYLGIDPSPAPGLDRSIGTALEALIGGPFGSASTLHACSVVTAALKDLKVRTCGYAGLMLPVAALSARWQKPLSARLFPVPGKAAGELTALRDPMLTHCPIFSVA